MDVLRATPNWRNTGPRHDFVIVQGEEPEGLWFAQILEIFDLQLNGQRYQIAHIRRFQTRLRRSKLTDYIELEDQGVHTFIFLDTIVRSCLVISPNAHAARHIVVDLLDSDMYLRLRQV